MKLAKFSLAMAALAMSSVALAGNLTASSSVDVLAVDGVKVAKGSSAWSLANNKVHQVVVEVSDIVNGSYFSIDPLVLTFKGTNEDVQVLTPKLNTNLAVDKFKKELNFQIQTSSGKNLDYKMDNLKGEGFAPNGRVEDNLAKYNTSKAKASVPEFANAAFEKKGQIVVQTNDVKEEQLQLLFKKADKETQKRFLEWAKKQK